MKLKLSEVNIIYETLISIQEYDVTGLLGHRLTQVWDEIEPDNISYEKQKEGLIKKYGVEKNGRIDVAFAPKESQEKCLEEINKLLDSEKEYNIEIIPRNLIYEQGRLPLKFQRNLRKIISSE